MSSNDERLVTLSHAARLLGLNRNALQQIIQAGEVTTFEGMLKLGDLTARFPKIVMEDTTTIERMKQIKEAAVFKAHQASKREVLPNALGLVKELDILRAHVDELTEQLAVAKQESQTQWHMIVALKGKLDHVIENCDQKQKVMLGAITRWMSAKMEKHSS